MIIITGAAGFIGSYVAGMLNRQGYRDLVLVDDFTPEIKQSNFITKQARERVDRNHFFEWVVGKAQHIQAIIHLGARTNTAEFDIELLDHLNFKWSQQIWHLCVEHQIPLIYASSAATYGGGEYGYSTSAAIIQKLQPLNPYGWSKQKFDLWVLSQTAQPVFWAGLKFFNVYGPNEYHKGRMASVIYHAWKQIGETGAMKLFRSHREDVQDGQQKRDFIYVQDVGSVIQYLMEERPASGIYNLGTGQARSFQDLAMGVFHALKIPVDISYIDIPADIRDTYQYYTEADMHGLRAAGYTLPFTTLEDGIEEYVNSFLNQGCRIY